MNSLREASVLFAPLLLGFACHGLCIRTADGLTARAQWWAPDGSKEAS
jgi:hypothetical protein